MRKCDELTDPNSCFSKAGAEEPLSVLRAKDLLAPQLVRLWAAMAGGGAHEPDKIAEALRWANDAEEWRRQWALTLKGAK